MIKDIERQKAELKAKMNKEIDEYFEKFERSSNEPNFNIDKIEELMMENDSKIKKVMTGANSGLTSNVEAEVKKNARNAEGNWKRQKQGKS